MTDVTTPQPADMSNIVSNAFGEQSLFAINHNVFQSTDASTVFRSYFGDDLFKNDTFYVLAGMDSGLLYQYIKAHGIPKGSRYLFIELPEILEVLVDLSTPPKDISRAEMAIATEENWLEMAHKMGAKNYAALEQMTLLRSLGATHGHYHNYQAFWQKLESEFDALAWEQKHALGNRPYFICQIENLTENQVPAILLKDTFKGKTAVVLASGPSLDDFLPWIKKNRKDLLVIAVTRTSRTLLNADIQPDIFVSIDPLPINLAVSRDVFQFQDDTLLVNDFHLYPDLLSSWGGEKMFIGPRYPWPTPLQPENLLPTKGTTVTNSALDLAMITGVKQIVLCGVDFCFGGDGYSYASGSPEHDIGPRLQPYEQRVKTNSGEMADTLNSYATSAWSVDELAQNALSQGCQIINPAPGAMQLLNVKHIPVEEISLTPMEQEPRQIIADNTPHTNSKSRIKLYKEVLNEVDRVLKELNTIKGLSEKAITYNRKLFAKDEPGAGIHNKEKVERIEEQLNNKHASMSKFIRSYGAIYFIPIKFLNDNLYAEDLEESCKLYHQAFITTCTELIEYLRLARTRTASRLEEEKPRPNVQHLLKQWRSDEHPGRAIHWTQHHKDYIEQLPKIQLQALQTFKDSFNDTINEITERYYPNIDRENSLSKVSSWGQGYFVAKDKDKLSRLLDALQRQHDQDSVTHYISLVQGYLAELSNDLQGAIAAYQRITEGTAYINALLRLFELYSEVKDYGAAVEALKDLSSIDPAYKPMYADMLQSTGNIDSAVETYTDYLLANPDDLRTMMKLGELFQQCGSAEGVGWTMNYILGKEPENQTAKKMLAEANLTEQVSSPS